LERSSLPHGSSTASNVIAAASPQSPLSPPSLSPSPPPCPCPSSPMSPMSILRLVDVDEKTTKTGAGAPTTSPTHGFLCRYSWLAPPAPPVADAHPCPHSPRCCHQGGGGRSPHGGGARWPEARATRRQKWQAMKMMRVRPSPLHHFWSRALPGGGAVEGLPSARGQSLQRSLPRAQACRHGGRKAHIIGGEGRSGGGAPVGRGPLCGPPGCPPGGVPARPLRGAVPHCARIGADSRSSEATSASETLVSLTDTDKGSKIDAEEGPESGLGGRGLESQAVSAAAMAAHEGEAPRVSEPI